ncbi:MAG: FAD-binding oxidoreductase [Spirochaetales bacterium]|nr:FAD-binding oxidoreductase [Spirochaetales bacterium]
MNIIRGKEAILEKVPDLLYDESRMTGGVPQAVCFPETTEDLQDILREAEGSSTPVVCAGAQTGITAGGTPQEGCILISFSAMKKIEQAAEGPDNTLLLRCQPGVTLEEIEGFLSGSDEDAPEVPGVALPRDSSFVYLPDPTEMSASLGGTIATNASGARSFRFGSTRKHVEELLVVLIGGETLTLKRGQVAEREGTFSFTTDQGTSLVIPAPDYPWTWKKNASGYYSAPEMDLVDLFIGSEGTLGVIARAGIRLVRRPEILSGVSFFPHRDKAFSFASFLRKDERVISVEYFDGTALNLLRTYGEGLSLKLPLFPPQAGAAVFWEYWETPENPLEEELERWEEVLVESSSSLDLTWSGFDDDEKARLKVFRHAVPEIVNTRIAEAKRSFPSVRKVSTDAAVSEEHFKAVVDRFFEALEPSDLDFAVFGHLGDCHLHFNLIPKSDEEMARAVELYAKLMDITLASGGTVSAEHGIGRIKTAYLEKMYPPAALRRMKEIKTALDPSWILNRGTLFSSP